MAFEQINFASILPLGNPALANIVDTFMKGYQASQMPAAIRRETERQQLANAMAQLKLQQEPQAFQADLQGKNLVNTFQQMLNQEQPQKFNSQQARQALLNNLTNMQINEANMNVDPNAKIAYFKTLFDKLNQLRNGGADNSTGNPADGASLRPPLLPGAGQDLTITPEQATNLTNAGVAKPNLNTNYTPQYAQQLGDYLQSVLLPPAKESPAQKRANDLQAFKDRKAYEATLPGNSMNDKVKLFEKKQEAKTGMITPATATQNQQALLAIKNTLPMLDELKTMAPEQTYGRFLRPIDQKNYETKRTLILDKLMASLKVPKTSEPYLKLEKALSRSIADTDETYAARLESIKKDLLQQGGIYANAANIIKNPFPQKKDIKSMSTEDLLKIYRGAS